MAGENTAWQLEDFVDSLVVELDKARETLAVKAINKPLSYTVKDLALDLNIFPSYDGEQVRFVTAQPGQQGASKVSIQLGSITDQQVRATTKAPGEKSEVSLDDIELDRRTRRKLQKLGVRSVDDLAQLERKNVDLKKVTDDVDYVQLAKQIGKAKRGQTPPRVTSASLELDAERRPYLLLRGSNLAVDPAFEPVAVVNERLAEVLSRSHDEVRIQLGQEHRLSKQNEVILTVDPYAVIRLNLKA